MKLHLISRIRTNNFNDSQMMQKVKAMWRKSSHKLNSYKGHIYGIYYDYESDYKGDYCLSVAVEEPSYSKTFITINKSESYEVFKVNTTDDQGILNTWQKIWRLEDEGVLQRKYSYDFEKYFPDGNIEIHIATESSK